MAIQSNPRSTCPLTSRTCKCITSHCGLHSSFPPVPLLLSPVCPVLLQPAGPLHTHLSPCGALSSMYFQVLRADVAFLHCSLHLVLVALLLPPSRALAMTQLAVEHSAGQSVLWHPHHMSKPAQLVLTSSLSHVARPQGSRIKPFSCSQATGFQRSEEHTV